MSFDSFGLDPRQLQVIEQMGITTPTPIQEQAIPHALDGTDVIGLAQTGTGKTLAYVLPSLTRLAQGSIQRNSMLVLVPTRELAVQVERVVEEVGRPQGIGSVAVYGGVSLDKQKQALKQGRAVTVATPGRLLDHMGRGNIRFENLMILVLDEADRMLDMGFLPDIQRIMRKLPKMRQTLMFSATFPGEIAYLADRMLKDPVRVQVGHVRKPVDSVHQILYPVRPEDKMTLLFKILEEEEIHSAVIFLHTRIRTERLARALHKANYSVAEIHGDRSQIQREEALDGFRNGEFKILVATDIAARGLDIEGVSHIINYDIPPSADDYLHRIGRTARADAEGDAITFVCPTDHAALEKIEVAVGHRLPRKEYEGAPVILSLYTPRPEKTEGTEPGAKPERLSFGRKPRKR